MLAVLTQIDGYDPVAGTAVTLRASSVDDAAVCHLDGQTWWPAIAQLPTLAYDFGGGTEGRVSAADSSLSLSLEPFATFPRLALADARIRLWTGEAGAPWSAWTQRFDGRVTEQPTIEGGMATIAFAVDDRWLDRPLLALYEGTGGVEGPAALKGSTKPLALGAPRYVGGVMIDSANVVMQLHGYGAINDVEAALEGLARFGASVGDFASHAALVAATIPAGRWGTCKAQGLVRHGAPPAPSRRFSYLVQGDAAGPDGWARLPGDLIRRIALLSGGVGKIDDASLEALNTARPYPLSLHVEEQTTARELIEQIAMSVNAVSGVSWLGKLFVAPVEIGTPALTLAADGSALPPVASAQLLGKAPPYWRIALQAERTWSVHRYEEVAFTAQLVDRGAYAAGETYREGNIVQHENSSWLYINPSPSAGNAPPALPTTENAWWRVLAKAGENGQPGPGAFTLTLTSKASWDGRNLQASGSTGWGDTGAYSDQKFVGGAIVSYFGSDVAGPEVADFMVGLNADAAGSHGYADLDYAWQHYYGPKNGVAGNPIGYWARAWAGGVHQLLNQAGNDTDIGWDGTYANQLHYDGSKVRWIYNGVVVHELDAPANLVLAADVSWRTKGALNSFIFAAAGRGGRDGEDGLGIDGKMVEFVWKRWPTQPEAPTGDGIPAGWSDDQPAGTDPLWMSTARQELDGTLVAGESWSTPRRMDGPAGEDGIPGISPIAITATPAQVVIDRDSAGAVKSGELPAVIANAAQQGTGNVPITSVAIVSTEGCTASVSGSTVSISAISASQGSVTYDVAASGQTKRMTVPFVTKDDPPPPAAASISISSTTIANPSTLTQQGGTVVLNASASGKIRASYGARYKGEELAVRAQLQYRPLGGAWSSIGSAVTGTTSVVIGGEPGEPSQLVAGSVSLGPYTLTGLTPEDQQYEFRVVSHKTFAGIPVTSHNGSIRLEHAA